MAGAERVIDCPHFLQATDNKQLTKSLVGTKVAMLMVGAREARGW